MLNQRKVDPFEERMIPMSCNRWEKPEMFLHTFTSVQFICCVICFCSLSIHEEIWFVWVYALVDSRHNLPTGSKSEFCYNLWDTNRVVRWPHLSLIIG